MVNVKPIYSYMNILTLFVLYKKNTMFFRLAEDCVRLVFFYLHFDESVQLVSTNWLTYGLKRWARDDCWAASSWGANHISRKRRWSCQLKLYAANWLVKVSMAEWKFFCTRVLGRRRRCAPIANSSWQTTSRYHMTEQWRCRGCGVKTTAHVFRVGPLCLCCRADPQLKYSYMVPVHKALQHVPRKRLREIPYHYGGFAAPHWRFWSDIATAAEMNPEESKRQRLKYI